MNNFIEDYYTTGGLVKAKNKSKVLKNEELYQLYKKPKKDRGQEIPHMQDIEKDAVMQCDLLYLPEDDKGYKYALVCVDVGSGLTDAEPLKERDASAVLAAFKKITNREPLKGCPTYMLQSDSGSEFKGVFAKYMYSLGITIRYGKVGRSRMQSYVEQRNKVIGQALFHRMTAQEILTEEQSNHWVARLKVVIKAINKFVSERTAVRKTTNTPYIPKNTVLLSVGQPVRVMLDKPEDTFQNKLHGTFRASDIRWSRELHHVSNIIFDENEPVLYQIDGNPSPAYTFNQLQVVDVHKLQAPIGKLVVEGSPSTYVVQSIQGKRKEKNKIEYLIHWKGYDQPPDFTWEKRTELMQKPKIKNMITKYEEMAE